MNIEEEHKNLEPNKDHVPNVQINKLQKISDINKELTDGQFEFNSETIKEETIKKEQEFQNIVKDLELHLGQPLKPESVSMIYKSVVDSNVKMAIEQSERFDRLNIQKIILENIDNEEFRKKISSMKSEKVSEQVFEKSLEQLLEADIDLPKSDRIRLFRQTLEYYSQASNIKEPLLHSTGSYGLRKGLEEGFEGGHASEGGEGALKFEEGSDVQKELSVTHPNYASAETFQQLFARTNGLPEITSLKIDSEIVTKKSLAEKFIEELYNSLTELQLRDLAVDRINSFIKSKEEEKEKWGKLRSDKWSWVIDLSPELKPITKQDLTEEAFQRLTGEVAKQEFIEEFKNRRPRLDNNSIAGIVALVKDEKVKESLIEEARTPFACFISFEGKGKEQNLWSIKNGQKPTHIPFEDFYNGKLVGEDIKEIRIPEVHIEKVQTWLEEKKLNNVKLVPLELFEVKSIIESNL